MNVFKQKFLMGDSSYVKIITTEEEIQEWKRLINQEYRLDSKIMETLSEDMDDIRSKKLIAIGFFSKNKEGKYFLESTQSVRELTVSELKHKILYKYSLDTIYYDDISSLINKLLFAESLHEITRFAHNKTNKSSIHIIQQMLYIVGLIRYYKMMTLKDHSNIFVSITSRLHALRHGKLFGNLISDKYYPLHLKSKNADLEISIVTYDLYDTPDKILNFFTEYQDDYEALIAK